MRVNELMQRGIVKEFPPCDECNARMNDMKDMGNPFLVVYKDRLVCGKCCIKLMQPKICECGYKNNSDAKFCSGCSKNVI